MSHASNEKLLIRYNITKNGFNSDIDLSLSSNGITSVFGPSGSGKTTLLRCLAGLEKIVNGTVIFRDAIWQNANSFVPCHKRPVGYVFQEASLFTHLNVKQNLNYGWSRTPKSRRKILTDNAIDLLGIQSLLQRYPSELSGGQKQRVAIARTLVTSPDLLLMDEPLSGLDATSKAEILPYLESLRTELALPIIYVSHSFEEVVRISDSIVLIDNGKITANGPINHLLTDPGLVFAQLEEASAIVKTKVASYDPHYHLTYLEICSDTDTDDQNTIAISQKRIPMGANVYIRILAKDVSIALTPNTNSSINNSIHARVLDTSDTQDSAQILVRLKVNSTIILSRITRKSFDLLNLKTEMNVYAQIKSVSLMRNTLPAG